MGDHSALKKSLSRPRNHFKSIQLWVIPGSSYLKREPFQEEQISKIHIYISDKGKVMLKTKNVVKLVICVCNVVQTEWDS